MLYRKADHIISLLPGIKDYLTPFGIAPEKILWLPNSIDPDIVPEQFEKTSADKFTIMYAGSHGLANDLDTFLDAAKLLQSSDLREKIRICLIGQGPEKRRLVERKLKENIELVEFRDPVAKTEIYNVLNQAQVFLMSLKYSPIYRFGISPNKLFDYLLMERPIIFAVDTPFNPVAAANAGFTIAPGSAAVLANTIEKLYHLPEAEKTAMGKRGKAYVLENHTIQKLSTSLENLMMTTVKLNHAKQAT